MDVREDRTADILTRAERFSRTCAGVARLEDVLAGPSYRARPEGEWTTSLSNDAAVTQCPAEARSVPVLGLHHPEDDPGPGWWEQGNTWGNKALIKRSETPKVWLEDAHGLGRLGFCWHDDLK